MVHYLTVHDIVWINTTLTGQTNLYDFQTLEAVVAAQYSYGPSVEPLAQAANLLNVCLAKAPFTAGNRRTAFVALLTFLIANGFGPKADDTELAQQFARVADGQTPAEEFLSAATEPTHAHLGEGATLRMLVTHVCNRYVKALSLLTKGDE